MIARRFSTILSAFFNKAMAGFWAVILVNVNQDFTVKPIITILTELQLKVRNDLTKFLRPFDFTKFFQKPFKIRLTKLIMSMTIYTNV